MGLGITKRNRKMIQRTNNMGMVYLVGAGPGDPDLITRKGLQAIQQAEVIVYDRLVNPDLLAEATSKAEHIYVGKAPGKSSASQEQINTILAVKANQGKNVVRLKGGDPFVFGRGGEEAHQLERLHIPYQVVPGISSAFAAPVLAGIPVTHRLDARSVTVITGHTTGNSATDIDWRHLAKIDTLVIMMGMRNLSHITGELERFGRSPQTPAAVVERAGWDTQRQASGTLSTIAENARELSPPATIIIGNVVNHAFTPSTPHTKTDAVPPGVFRARPRPKAAAAV